MIRTSKEWWAETKASPEKLIAWLRKQYHGEVTAAERIERYCIAKLAVDDARGDRLRVIADQERQHAEWVAQLLRTRGEMPQLLPTKPERYWTRALAAMHSFEDAAGVAHHAETMRLERIWVIAADLDAPFDIRETFARILQDERWHAAAFKALAGPQAVERTAQAHQQGAAAIGFLSVHESL